jgi:hypothetical protein
MADGNLNDSRYTRKLKKEKNGRVSVVSCLHVEFTVDTTETLKSSFVVCTVRTIKQSLTETHTLFW